MLGFLLTGHGFPTRRTCLGLGRRTGGPAASGVLLTRCPCENPAEPRSCPVTRFSLPVALGRKRTGLSQVLRSLPGKKAV